MMNEAATAKLILSRIRRGDLAGGFTRLTYNANSGPA